MKPIQLIINTTLKHSNYMHHNTMLLFVSKLNNSSNFYSDCLLEIKQCDDAIGHSIVKDNQFSRFIIFQELKGSVDAYVSVGKGDKWVLSIKLISVIQNNRISR